MQCDASTSDEITVTIGAGVVHRDHDRSDNKSELFSCASSQHVEQEAGRKLQDSGGVLWHLRDPFAHHLGDALRSSHGPSSLKVHQEPTWARRADPHRDRDFHFLLGHCDGCIGREIPESQGAPPGIGRNAKSTGNIIIGQITETPLRLDILPKNPIEVCCRLTYAGRHVSYVADTAALPNGSGRGFQRDRPNRAVLFRVPEGHG